MGMTKMTHYQQRKVWRVKLNDARNVDRDHSPDRYKHDAKVLNRAMSMFKITGKLAQW
jgi:hypothetical protein